MITYDWNELIILIFYIESNGSGVNLLKIGAMRRKTKHEIEEEKEEARIKEEAIKDKLEMFDAMQKKITDLTTQVQSNEAAANILNDILNKGDAIQDEHGVV